MRDMLREMADLAVKRSTSVKEGDLVVVEAEDYMDDGSAIRLKLTINVKEGSAHFDFEGTSPEVKFLDPQKSPPPSFSVTRSVSRCSRFPSLAKV